jgi:hypothetical protein
MENAKQLSVNKGAGGWIFKIIQTKSSTQSL